MITTIGGGGVIASFFEQLSNKVLANSAIGTKPESGHLDPRRDFWAVERGTVMISWEKGKNQVKGV